MTRSPASLRPSRASTGSQAASGQRPNAASLGAARWLRVLIASVRARAASAGLAGCAGLAGLAGLAERAGLAGLTGLAGLAGLAGLLQTCTGNFLGTHLTAQRMYEISRVTNKII